jgi:hypothetical protein
LRRGPSRRARALPAGLAALAAGFTVLLPGGIASPAAAQAPGPVVRLSYRALQPGEPILVVLESDGSVRTATATFLGATVELRPAPGGARSFAFVGIDVQAKPGQARLTVKLVKTGGLVENVRQDLVVAAKAFPSTKLQLKPEYVTPPASALARIKREAELVALAMSVVTPEWLGEGPFALPHDAPSWENFGQRRLNNNIVQSLHAGLDLRVPFGQPSGPRTPAPWLWPATSIWAARPSSSTTAWASSAPMVTCPS